MEYRKGKVVGTVNESWNSGYEEFARAPFSGLVNGTARARWQVADKVLRSLCEPLLGGRKDRTMSTSKFRMETGGRTCARREEENTRKEV